MRLRAVARPTVAKELSALRNFLSWAERQNEIDEAPHVRNPPRRSTGTAFKGGKSDLGQRPRVITRWRNRLGAALVGRVMSRKAAIRMISKETESILIEHNV